MSQSKFCRSIRHKTWLLLLCLVTHVLAIAQTKNFISGIATTISGTVTDNKGVPPSIRIGTNQKFKESNYDG